MHEDDDMVQCPYNKSHMILKHRLSVHLIKCRKQNPSKQFLRCTFNSSHDVPASEFEDHCKNCEDRSKLESFMYVVSEPKQEEDVVYHPEVHTMTENWDEENSATGSYLDVKDEINENRMISRLPPPGLSKSERKAFYRQEAERFREISQRNKSSSSSFVKKEIYQPGRTQN